MTGNDGDQTPWHHSTPAVLGASVAGVAAIGLIVAAVMFVGRQGSQPTQAPLDFVDPTFTTTSATTITTTMTTRISPPSTTEINPPLTPLSPTTTTSGTSETSPTPTSETPTEEDEEQTTTRRQRGPRTNITRTLYPLPPN